VDGQRACPRAAIRKLGGSPLPELRAIASELHAAGAAKVPTLLKYCDPDSGRTEAEHAIARTLMKRIPAPESLMVDSPPAVRILRYDQDALLRLTCAVAYPNQTSDWEALSAHSQNGRPVTCSRYCGSR